MKKYKIITAAVVAAILVFAFWYGGDSPSLHGFDIKTEATALPKKVNPKTTEEPKIASETEEPTAAPTALPETTEIISAEVSESSAEPTEEPTAENAVVSVTEQLNTSETERNNICTLSVRCDSILNNISWLKEEKRGLVPSDGVIFEECETEFFDGESVFNLLVREMKKHKIHMEFVNTPIYNSAYIEGIANLYEFDCGELSGWMYSVNGIFPNYGCSNYILKNGDKVEWVYTCDLGNDVGGGYSARNGN